MHKVVQCSMLNVPTGYFRAVKRAGVSILNTEKYKKSLCIDRLIYYQKVGIKY